jgi:hypothetical protein
MTDKVWVIQTKYIDGTSMSGGGEATRTVGGWTSRALAERWLEKGEYMKSFMITGYWNKKSGMGDFTAWIIEVDVVE